MDIIDSGPIEVFANVVAESGRTIDLPRGEVLFSEGDSAVSLDFLVKGAVRLWHPRVGQEPLVVGIVHAGQLVEPGPFFLGERHETSASAVTPCRVIRTAHSVIEELLAAQPELRIPLLELLHNATAQSIRIARFLRTAHRIPETSGTKREGSHKEVMSDTYGVDRTH